MKLYRLYRVLKDSDVVKHDNIADKTNILLFSNSHGLALYFSLQSSDLKDIWFDAIWDSIRRLQGAVDNSLQTIRFAPHIATAESSDGGIYLESYATKRYRYNPVNAYSTCTYSSVMNFSTEAILEAAGRCGYFD